MTIERAIHLAASIFEIAGIATMLLLGAVAAIRAAVEGLARRPDIYPRLRQRIGRGILLGLELLVAADIIRTVSEMPTLERVAVLAGIVLIRTFLSFALEVELEHRWPWQRERDGTPLAAGRT